jgi:ABC-2 type transport system permease protein
MRAVWTLVERELVRFFRQPNRLAGAVGQPLIFWLLFGAAFQGMRPAGVEVDYAQYFVPGIAAMIVLFTAIFSTMSIIEDRREGFLQAVLVAPVPRSGVVLGKVLGGTLLAMIQGCFFLVLASVFGIPLSGTALLSAVGVLFLMGFALTGLGFCIAWRMDSTQGFHAVMSVFLLPMWVLSGAVFPLEGAASWLAWIMRLNPLTYGVRALREALWLPAGGLDLDLAVTVLFGAATFVAARWLAGRRTATDLV